MKFIHIPSIGIKNYSVDLKYESKLKINLSESILLDEHLAAYDEFLEYTDSETYYDINLILPNETRLMKFPISMLMKCYEEDIPVSLNLFDYEDSSMVMTIICYLVVPKNTIPTQPFEIFYKDNVYIPLGVHGYADCYDKYINLKQYAKRLGYTVSGELFMLAVDIKHNSLSWLYEYIFDIRLLSGLTEFMEYATKTRSLPTRKKLIKWIYKACINMYPKYADILTGIIDIYNKYPRFRSCVKYKARKEAKDLLDLFIIDVTNNYLPYIIRMNDELYIFNQMIIHEYVYKKYPDIVNNISRFSWWLDGVIPYAILTRLNERKSIVTLYNIAGLIGFWSVMSESGNGCNSWILLHPIKRFEQFAHILLNNISYDRILSLLHIVDDYYHTTINDSRDAMLMVNEVFFKIDYNIFYSLEKSIEFIQNVIKIHNPKQYFDVKYKLRYEDDMIPSPSGMTLIPFVITN